MKNLNNIFVKDIVQKNSTAIFILESPHKRELEGGLPLLGDSGLVVSQALLSNKNKPAGSQIIDDGISFSIMNTFQKALQLDSSLNELNNNIRQLKYNHFDVRKYKKDLLNIIKQDPSLSNLADSYKERLNLILDNSVNNIKIIVCGMIAQVFFEYVLKINSIPFGKESKNTVMSHNAKVFYVEHPFPKNDNTFWSSDKLYEFVYS